jgi:glucosyltransferase GtrII-like protein
MAASLNRSSAGLNSSGLTAVIGDSAPHLTVFTVSLLLLLYGYEIFNFSLSIDEELFGSGYEIDWWRLAISQGRWALGLFARVLPPLGNIPMLSTVLFCAGLGVSACVLARVLFRKHSAQWAFAGIFVSSPLWPHLAEFNTSSWGVAMGCVLVTSSLLFFLTGRRFGDIWAACLLAVATGIYESFYVWFLVLLCIRYLSVLLGMAPVGVTEPRLRFPWLRSGLVAVGGMLGYLAMRRLLLAALSLELTYVQGFVRLADFTTAPAAAFARTFWRCWFLLNGGDRIFLGYGHVVTLLPLLGLLILIVRLLWRGPLTPSQRLLAGTILAAALVFALSPLMVSAGTIPARALISWVPISAFLAGVALSFSGRFEKPMYGALFAALLISIWVTVSLFYTDHLARQRDQFLAVRIMTRVDNILPNPPPGRIPLVVVGAVPAKAAGPFRKLGIFGDSFFDSLHEGGNPYRVAAYLRTLGVDTLEPRPLEHVDPSYRPHIEAMPVWPAAGSVAMVNGMLVIKLGPL